MKTLEQARFDHAGTDPGWDRSSCRQARPVPVSRQKSGRSAADARLREAGGNILEQGETTCCYAKSEKSWIDDPAGIAWETFCTTGESTVYGDGSGENVARIAHEKQAACCAREPAAKATAC